MKNIVKIAVMMLLVVMATACKSEKQELSGTWRWSQTSGGFAGVQYSPETEGFDAEITFKNGRFTFYKDGHKVTSGAYQVTFDVDGTILHEEADGDYTHVWFSLSLPASCIWKVMAATNNKIPLSHKSSAIISYDNSSNNQILTLSDNGYDGYSITFVKPSNY